MTTRLSIGLVTIGLGVALTACGGGNDFTDKSGKQIADASKTAMKGLDSVKVVGTVATGGNEVSIDIQTNDKGDCTGSIGTGGGKAQLLGTGGSVWFKPDEAFWRASASDTADRIIQVVGDKWVVVPASEDGFDEFCDIDKLFDQLLESDKDSDAKYTKGKTSSVDGKDAVAVKSTSKSDGTSTGYVRVDDPHYLVKIEKTKGTDTGKVTFSEFDSKVEVEAPADADVIDLNNLAG
jgi:hypothetical protein